MKRELQSKDFRIGNSVFYRKGFPMKVVGIYDDEILLDFKGNEGDMFSLKPNEVERIPLCHKSLIELGFVQDVNIEYRYIIESPKFITELLAYDLDDGSVRIGDKWFERRIGYVSDMQNLYFALTGEELTIKE